MIPKRVLAKLCLYLRNKRGTVISQAMRSHLLLWAENRLLRRAITRFFRTNSPEMVKYFTMLIFQCWALNDCKLKEEVTDKDFAEFLDQLNDLVSSAHRYHRKIRYRYT